MKKRFLSALVCSTLFCSGCAARGAEVVVIDHEPYERAGYQTTEVQKGDLQPKLELTLTADGYEQIIYDATNANLQLDKVYVSVGDKVKKGDLLVSFRSESIQKTIDDYSEQADQNRLLVEHYTNLMRIDKTLDYSSDIKMLKQDIEVAGLYIEEAQGKLESYQIVAERSGTITDMNEYLQKGMFVPGRKQITQVCGSGNYTVDKPGNYDFSVGEIYQAAVGVVSYDLRVKKISKGKVIFEPISDMSSVSEDDELTMVVTKPELKNVIYVDASAVYEGSDSHYVYVVDEDGYRDAVEVKLGEQVDDYYVVTDGLAGGEKVTLY